MLILRWRILKLMGSSASRWIGWSPARRWKVLTGLIKKAVVGLGKWSSILVSIVPFLGQTRMMEMGDEEGCCEVGKKSPYIHIFCSG